MEEHPEPLNCAEKPMEDNAAQNSTIPNSSAATNNSQYNSNVGNPIYEQKNVPKANQVASAQQQNSSITFSQRNSYNVLNTYNPLTPNVGNNLESKFQAGTTHNSTVTNPRRLSSSIQSNSTALSDLTRDPANKEIQFQPNGTTHNYSVVTTTTRQNSSIQNTSTALSGITRDPASKEQQFQPNGTTGVGHINQNNLYSGNKLKSPINYYTLETSTPKDGQRTQCFSTGMANPSDSLINNKLINHVNARRNNPVVGQQWNSGRLQYTKPLQAGQQTNVPIQWRNYNYPYTYKGWNKQRGQSSANIVESSVPVQMTNKPHASSPLSVFTPESFTNPVATTAKYHQPLVYENKNSSMVNGINGQTNTYGSLISQHLVNANNSSSVVNGLKTQTNPLSTTTYSSSQQTVKPLALEKRDSSMVNDLHVQTNQRSKDIYDSSQQIMLKLLDPSRLEEQNQKIYNNWPEALQQAPTGSLKLTGNAYFSDWNTNSMQEGTLQSVVNQSLRSQKMVGQTSNGPSNPLQMNETFKPKQFNTLSDPIDDGTFLVADEYINDPWLDKCYKQIQALKEKCLYSLRISYDMYCQRERVSVLSRSEKIDLNSLRKMINFLCMPQSQMKNVSMQNFSYNKIKILSTYNMIQKMYPPPTQQNIQSQPPASESQPPKPEQSLNLRPENAFPEIKVNVQCPLSRGQEGIPKVQENMTSKPVANKGRRKRAQKSKNSNNQRNDNQQQQQVEVKKELRVQNPKANGLQIHEGECVQNREQQTIPTQDQEKQIAPTNEKFVGQKRQYDHGQKQKPHRQRCKRLELAPNLHANNSSPLNVSIQRSTSIWTDQKVQKSTLSEAPTQCPGAQVMKQPAIAENMVATNNLLSNEPQNKLKRGVNATAFESSSSSSSSSANKVIEPINMLLNEINSINQKFMETKLELDSGDNVGAIKDENRTIVMCIYTPSLKAEFGSNLPSHIFPVLKLRLIVPFAYPKVAPIISPRSTNDQSIISESLTKKAHVFLTTTCQTYLSLEEITSAWQSSARAVTIEYARSLQKPFCDKK